MKHTIKLATTEAVVVEDAAAGVTLSLEAFGLVLARRALTDDQAIAIRDALSLALKLRGQPA